jgi:hypothetical protein
MIEEDVEVRDGTAAETGSRRPPLIVPLRPGVPRRLVMSAALGVVALAFLLYGWYQVSAETDIYAQLPYFLSAGGVALALMLGAVALFVDYEHSCDRQGIALLLERLDDLERRVARIAPDAETAGPTAKR